MRIASSKAGITIRIDHRFARFESAAVVLDVLKAANRNSEILGQQAFEAPRLARSRRGNYSRVASERAVVLGFRTRYVAQRAAHTEIKLGKISDNDEAWA